VSGHRTDDFLNERSDRNRKDVSKLLKRTEQENYENDILEFFHDLLDCLRNLRIPDKIKNICCVLRSISSLTLCKYKTKYYHLHRG